MHTGQKQGQTPGPIFSHCASAVSCIGPGPVSVPVPIRLNYRLVFYSEIPFLQIDPCTTNPCENNAECDDNIDSYSCRCKSDYTGTNCETQIDDSAGNQCGRNGEIHFKISKYQKELMVNTYFSLLMLIAHVF